jgi:hypothetical protein
MQPTAPSSRRGLLDGPWYPLLVATAIVMAFWVEAGVNAVTVLRPLGVAWLITASMLLVGRAVLGTWSRAALAAVVGVLAIRSGSWTLAAGIVILAGLAVAIAATVAQIRRRRVGLGFATRGANGISAILLAVVMGGAVVDGTLARIPADLRLAAPLATTRRIDRRPSRPPRHPRDPSRRLPARRHARAPVRLR